jgi:Amino acid synthesis
MSVVLRKVVTFSEEILVEQGRTLAVPSHRSVVAAVVANPYAGRYAEDLTDLIELGEKLGEDLGRRAVESLRMRGGAVQSFGKAAMVGEDGELEHAAAVLHPRLGAGLRRAIGGGKALVPSAKKMGGPGQTLTVPLGHIDAAYVRSHFDALELSVSDAPRRGEILVAVAVTDGGRPLARVGGLSVDEVVGEDGLR